MNKRQMLQLVDEKVKLCTKCPDFSNRTQTVFGSGDPDAKILLVGEAPGKDEDDQGVPFVGRAGELLTNILKAAGLERQNVYIANICKCRPPNNRTPKPEEAANCEPFLKLQIKVVNPKYIICLGNTAAQNLLKTNTSITYLRGSWYEYQDDPVKAKVLCTFHPSFLLRTPSAKQDVWNDLQMLLEDINE